MKRFNLYFSWQAQLNKIDNLGLGEIDCTRPGDFSVAANTMEDLAAIIDEVGIDQLQKQLGVDLSFVFANWLNLIWNNLKCQNYNLNNHKT